MLATHRVLDKRADVKILKEDKDEDNEIKKKITYCKVLSDMRVIMASCGVIVSMSALTFVEPILSIRV
jgi:hypothetical protein